MKYTLKRSQISPEVFSEDSDLNAEQRAVVQAPPGALLVLAGAGSGKTRTLSYRVARLASKGCPPERIMLVTFTNRAAKEMVSRIETLVGPAMRKCAAGTFHHVGHRLLRRFAPAVGLDKDFGILDPQDAQDLLRMAISEEGLAALTRQRFPQPKVVFSMLGLCTGLCAPLDKVLEQHFPKFVSQGEALARVQERYQTLKQRRNLCDFSDLLHYWHRFLHDPELAPLGQEIRESFDHILVDEYQDINPMQGQIVDAMARDHRSLTCVGDDAQSIYAFRGADLSQIMDFQQRHPDAKILALTTNYRSTPPILALTNRSIAHNSRQHRKNLVAARSGEVKPAVVPLRDPYVQAEFVAQRVLELHQDRAMPLGKMAVLYRNHAHSLELQVELTRRQIPHTVRSGMRFFEQAHIKDVVSFLRARENRRDALAWSRMLRLWPGVGQRSANEVVQALLEQGERPDDRQVLALLEQYSRNKNGRGAQALSSFCDFWAQLCAPQREAPAQAIEHIVKRHYGDHIDRNWDNAAMRREDLEHLAGYAKKFEDAQSFLADLSLVSGVSAEQVVHAAPPDDMLVLSTIHQSKGLEWDAVFVLHLVEGRFPMAQCLKDPAQLQEERRLFYVATTRAKDELHLCYPIWSDDRKSERPRMSRVSRFVGELDRSPPVFERWEIEEQAPAQEEHWD